MGPRIKVQAITQRQDKREAPTTMATEVGNEVWKTSALPAQGAREQTAVLTQWLEIFKNPHIKNTKE